MRHGQGLSYRRAPHAPPDVLIFTIPEISGTLLFYILYGALFFFVQTPFINTPFFSTFRWTVLCTHTNISLIDFQ